MLYFKNNKFETDHLQLYLHIRGTQTKELTRLVIAKCCLVHKTHIFGTKTQLTTVKTNCIAYTLV